MTTSVKDENEWLREELEDTEKRLEDALARLAGIEEEKLHWNFMEEVSTRIVSTQLKGTVTHKLTFNPEKYTPKPI